MTAWAWPGSTIVRVVDGDTVDAQVHRDLGFGGSAVFTVRLRLNRINTPPAHTALGRQAAALVAALTGGHPLLITTLGAYKYGGPDTSPGEWQAEVTLPDGSNLGDALVAAGLAILWDGNGVRPGG